MPKFCGPYKITKAINDTAFTLNFPVTFESRHNHNAFHSSLLLPYSVDYTYDRNRESPPPILLPCGEQQCEVERVVRHRQSSADIEYLVKWSHCPDHENTWQTPEDLQTASEALADYKRRVGVDSFRRGK